MNDSKLNVGYVRVSTDEQARGGYSIGFQKERIIERFERLGVDDYIILVDDGYSGKSMKRPKMKKVMKWIESDDIGLFVVYKLDRLSRNIKDMITFLDNCGEKEVTFQSIVEELDLSNAFGRMFTYIIGIFAQFEREQISERTISGKQQKASLGKYPGGIPPFGYDKIDDKLIVNEVEAKIVMHIFQMYVYEHRTFNYIKKEISKYDFKRRSAANLHDVYPFLAKTVYRGYINIPVNSNNRYDICEPLFNKKQIEDLEYRKIHNIRRYGYKHDYKYHNMVKINGRIAKHTRKTRCGKEFTYYFIKGLPYINETRIDKFIESLKDEKLVKSFNMRKNRVSKLSHELAVGNINKEEFDEFYNKILKEEFDESIKFKWISVSINRKKEIKFKLVKE